MPEFGESGFNFAAAAAAFSNAGNSASGNADSTGAGSGNLHSTKGKYCPFSLKEIVTGNFHYDVTHLETNLKISEYLFQF